MTTKLGRMVADFNGLLLIKSHHSLIKLSCTITKIFISPLPKCIWQPNVTECWLTLRSFISQCYSALCSCGLSISLDKLKPLYIHYHNLLGYPTWKGGNLLYLYWLPNLGSRPLIMKIFHQQSYTGFWRCGHVRLRENWKHYMFTTTVLMTTKLEIVTCNEKFPSQKSGK